MGNTALTDSPTKTQFWVNQTQQARLAKETIMFFVSPVNVAKEILDQLNIGYEEMMIPELRINDDVTTGQLKELIEISHSYFEYEADRDCHEMVIKQSFESYMAEVDIECNKQTGLDSSDFEDYDWRSEWLEDNEPSEAVSEFLINMQENW